MNTSTCNITISATIYNRTLPDMKMFKSTLDQIYMENPVLFHFSHSLLWEMMSGFGIRQESIISLDWRDILYYMS